MTQKEKQNHKNQIFEQVQALAIKTNHKMQDSFVWNFKSAFSWEWLDFKESKIYSDWDNVKHIDWKTSAKTWKLFVKKFEETRKLKINLIIDSSISLNTWFQELKKNKLIEAVALIVFSAMKSWEKISLKIIWENNFDENFLFWSWKNFSFKILEKLISEKFNKNFIDYKKFFQEFNSNKKNNNSINFIFSDFENIELIESIKKINKNKISWSEVVCVFIRDNLEEVLKNPETKNWISEFKNAQNSSEKILINWKNFSEFKNFLDKEIFEKRKDLAKFWIESLEIFEWKNVMDDFLEFFKIKERKG
jgi:hypothetical protein